MDSHNNNNNSNISTSMQTSTGAIDHFFPTSITTTSPHFFDTTFLDTSLSFPTSTTTSSWAQPPPEPTNSLNYPPPATTATTKPSTAAPGPTGRPSKKRSRASRRAPTTVLTTDTSNFRAMVQEFTGIPAPPFTSSSASPLHFPRSLNPPPSFLLKPFPNKFQPPFLPTSSLASPPPPPVLPHNNFQSLLQAQLLNNMPQQQQQQAMAASSSSGELRLPDVIGSGRDQTRHHHHHQQQQDAAASCKMNFPGPMSSTEFRAEKGSEGREGLMESWICSSD